jgi:hypothetical protein
MSQIYKPLFASPAQIIIGCDALAASTTVGRSSDVQDNSTNLYQDALLGGVIKMANSTPGASKSVSIYAYSDVDSTPHYTESVTGSAASFTRADPTNLKLVAVVAVPTQNVNFYFGEVSIAAAFGGILPKKWGICVFNDTGQALGGSGAADTVNQFWFTGVNAQGV